MKRIDWLMGTLAALLMTGSHPAQSAGISDDGLTVDVMSFNIRYGAAADGENRWELRKALVYDVIRGHAPAVIGVQEALRFQLDEIRAALPGYGEIGVGREEGGQGEHASILYLAEGFEVDESGTFWLSDTPDLPSRNWGNSLSRICTWARLVEKQSGRAFYFYNTHLDHESQASREKSVRLIGQRIVERTHPDPFVLAGDFNAGEDNPAITYLTGAGGGADRFPLPLADTFRVLHPDEDQVGTFHGFSGRSTGAKIDYIFVAPGTRTLDASILRRQEKGRYPSDHFPVTARLELFK